VRYSTEKTVLVSTGFHGDVLTLTKLIEARLKVVHFSTDLCCCLYGTFCWLGKFPRRNFCLEIYSYLLGKLKNSSQ